MIIMMGDSMTADQALALRKPKLPLRRSSYFSAPNASLRLWAGEPRVGGWWLGSRWRRFDLMNNQAPCYMNLQRNILRSTVRYIQQP